MNHPSLAHRILLPALLLLASCPATAVSDEPGTVDTTSEASTDPTNPNTPTTTSTDGPTSGDSSDSGPASTTTSGTTGDATGTTDDATSSTTGDDATGPSPECGDGKLDPGEECDNSFAENSDFGACTLHCKVNVCGDGLIHAGTEQCDDGLDNDDFLYGACGTMCARTKFCGDGEVNGPEECDRGKNNGTPDKDANSVPCGVNCTNTALLVFLSSVTYTVPELGGSAYEADKRCQKLAIAAMLPNATHFKAWISDKYTNPLDRFKPPIPDLAYALKNGLRVADDRAQLLSTGPLTGITLTETGVTLYDKPVWTDTAPDGKVVDAALACDNWTTDSPLKKARVGRSGVDAADVAAWQKWKAGQWTSYIDLSCNLDYRLYCFEQ